MPFGLKDKDVKLIKDILRLHTKVKETIIFGSRAMGTERPGSDIDLAVKGTNITTSDILNIKTQLDELPLAYEFDVVNYSTIKNRELIEHIDVHGISFYKLETGSKWKTYKLSEIADIIGGGTPSTTVDEYWNGAIPWLTPRDLTNYPYKYISKGERSITESGLRNSSAKLLPKGSVLLTSRAPIGYLVIAQREVCTNQGFKNFVINERRVDNEFLFYLLKNNVDNIKSVGTGTTFAEVSGTTLKNLEFLFPENVFEQKEIASILSSLDDKIELNLQMNQTLEAMAQAIFKEWCCVDSDNVPKGWSLKKLSELAEVTSSKRIFLEEYVKNGIPFYRGKEVTQLSKGESISTELFITEERYNEIKLKFGVPVIGDILITSVGTIGSVWLVDNNSPFYFKDGNVTWVKDYKTNITGEFIFQWFQTKEAMKQIKSVTIGSTQQALTIAALKNLTVLTPDSDTVSQTMAQLKNINSKRISNLNQIRTLTQIRDNLLPKLMTGKIEVKA